LQQIAVTVDEAGFVATFPQRSCAPAARIELSDAVAAKFLHEARDGTAFGRSDQQVDMVAHQHIRVQPDGCIGQRFAQQVQVAAPVVVVQEARQAIVTALNHVLRYSGQIKSREASHPTSFAAAAENETHRSLIRRSETSESTSAGSEADPVIGVRARLIYTLPIQARDKKMRIAIAGTLLLSFVAGTKMAVAAAYVANLVVDLNTMPDPSVGSDPAYFYAADGKVYFVAMRPDVGREVFATDAIAPAEQLIADLTPGPDSSTKAILGSAGGKLIVSTEGDAASRIWAVDLLGGQPAPLTSDSLPDGVNFVQPIGTSAGRVVFSDPNTGRLWASDGTPAGTQVIFQGGSPGVDPYAPDTVCRLPDRFLFTRRTPTGLELWRSDGTVAGTQMTQVLGDSVTLNFAKAAGDVCYLATTRGAGWSLWRSDGSAAGTTLLSQQSTGVPTRLATNATVAYLATSTSSTVTIWSSDSILPLVTQPVSYAFKLDVTSTHLLYTTPYNVSAGTYTFSIRGRATGASARAVTFNGLALTGSHGASLGFTVFGNRLLLCADGYVYSVNVETAEATQIPLNAGVGFDSADFAAIGDVKYFKGISSNRYNQDVWRSDGTADGTYPVLDIANGTAGSLRISPIVVRGNTLFLAAYDPSIAPQFGLVRTDGTAAGTHWLPRSTYDNGRVSGPWAFDGGIAFTSTEGSTTSTFLASADFSQVTQLLAPVAEEPSYFGGESVFAYACPWTGSVDAVCSFASGASQPHISISPLLRRSFGPLKMVGGVMLYFHHSSLWRTDGTAPGTFALASLFTLQDWWAGLLPSFQIPSFLHQGRLYFQGCTQQSISSCGIYATDGTTSPTLLASVESRISAYAAYQGNVAFTTAPLNFSNTSQLWTSGGTAQTTKAVTTTPYVGALVSAGGLLHMPLNDGYLVSDATAAGTRSVPLPPGTKPGGWIREFDGDVVFPCLVPGYGSETCVVDAAGTGMHSVIDISPGTRGSFPGEPAVMADALYLRADDGRHGSELWRISRTGDALFADGFDVMQ
jgi:ELWxxDGT repeat protein